MVKREMCRYLGDRQMCVNADATVINPLLAGQMCSKFRKHIACPYHVDAGRFADDEELNHRCGHR